MAYRIEQNENYIGNDRWEWSAWIEADSQELDEIKSVTWVLHPTFSPSRIETEDRENKFRIDTAGWGTFMLRAELTFKSEQEMKIIRRMLRLHYPDEADSVQVDIKQAATPPPSSKTGGDTVFLSYGSENESEAQVIGQAIKEMGVRVLNVNSVSAGLPIEAAIRKMIRESSAVVSIVGSDYASPYVLSESMIAQAEDRPVFTLLAKGGRLPEGMQRDRKFIPVNISDATSLQFQLSGVLEKLREEK